MSENVRLENVRLERLGPKEVTQGLPKFTYLNRQTTLSSPFIVSLFQIQLFTCVLLLLLYVQSFYFQ